MRAYHLLVSTKSSSSRHAMNTADYWESYYLSRPGAIDWYCGPENPVFISTVNRALEDHAKHRNWDGKVDYKEQIEVLHVGCGTSDFVSYLDYLPLGGDSPRQQQLEVVINHIDFARVCIETLQRAIEERDLEQMPGHGRQCISHRFHLIDCYNLEFWPDGSVDLIVDKGTVDTILSTKETPSEEPREQWKEHELNRLLREWERVLIVGGAILLVCIRNPYCILKYAGMDDERNDENGRHTSLTTQFKLTNFRLVATIYRVAVSPLEDPSTDCVWVIVLAKF